MRRAATHPSAGPPAFSLSWKFPHWNNQSLDAESRLSALTHRRARTCHFATGGYCVARHRETVQSQLHGSRCPGHFLPKRGQTIRPPSMNSYCATTNSRRRLSATERVSVLRSDRCPVDSGNPNRRRNRATNLGRSVGCSAVQGRRSDDRFWVWSDDGVLVLPTAGL
jgi:hypothetical protein